jgi:hypothetical protein
VCVDYTSLNKECHKDGYPLPQTYQIFDCTALYELLSFLDAYTGYHQISLAFDNKEKTMFITPFGVFCYTKMAFSHKNGGGGATYHKVIQIILDTQIGLNVKHTSMTL